VGNGNATPSQQTPTVPIERVAKLLTFALPLVYVCGFVVLSLYEAEFGIVDLSLVRVKALACGIAFVFFVAYPAIVGIRAFELFGLVKPAAARVDLGDKSNILYFRIIQVVDLYLIASYISLGLRVLFVPKVTVWIMEGSEYLDQRPISLLAFLAWGMCGASFVLGLVSVAAIGKHFRKKPKLATLLALLTGILFALLNFRMSDHLYFEIVGWCFLISLVSVLATSLIQAGKGLRAVDWELGIFAAFTIFTPWFATSLYGKIKPAFGGGCPAPVKMYLSVENALLKGKTPNVLVVEETEQGYYVIDPTSDDKRAIFMPRSVVSTAQFGSPKK
jgi:hypothetical protein